MDVKTADMQSPLDNNIVQRLRQENMALRAELRALHSVTQLQTSQSTAHAGHEQTFDFMKLPREIRNLVYELCLVVGEVRIGNTDWAQRPDMRCKVPKSAKAEVSLFTVSRQIRRETLEVYLSKNDFVIPNAVMWSSRGSSTEFAHCIPGCP
jgi:hypothetical protein